MSDLAKLSVNYNTGIQALAITLLTYKAQPLFMSDLDMDAGPPPLDLPIVPLNVITMMLHRMSFKDRFTCALVCKAWAEAATAVTHSIILRRTVQDLSCLQHWLEKHGSRLKVLHLHNCCRAALTALPCPQLQDLLLFGSLGAASWQPELSISRRVWRDIAAATKLTSVSLKVQTQSEQSKVVSALTALPDQQQLTWNRVICRGKAVLTNSSLLQRLTKLTALDLEVVAIEALLHLGLLTKLQCFSISYPPQDWRAAGCPGLQELTALTSLSVKTWQGIDDIPATVAQLTTLQHLDVPQATPTALNSLMALTGLTHLRVGELTAPIPFSSPLLLPGLQRLQLLRCDDPMPMSYLSSCTQIRVVELWRCNLAGPGCPVASTMLQCMVFNSSSMHSDGPAGNFSWQQVFPDPLPHLTSLQLLCAQPRLQQSDIERVVAFCSGLQALHLDTLEDSFAAALVHLPGLTDVRLWETTGQVFSAVAQLTGLRQLRLDNPREVSVAGLLQLTALEQLTSFGIGYFGIGGFMGVSYPIDVWYQLRRQMPDTLPGCKNAIVNKALAGHPSDVLARLLHTCHIMVTTDAAAAAAAAGGGRGKSCSIDQLQQVANEDEGQVE